MGGVPRFVRLSTSDNILSCKMATSGDWETAENDQIPPNMGVFLTGITLRGQKLSPNAILKFNMATSGS